MKKNALIIMAKSPLGGDIKTRLAPRLNKDERTVLYANLLEGVIKRLRNVRDTDTFITITPDNSGGYFDRFGLPCFAQGGGDIGQRLHRAIEHVLDLGYTRVAAVASDVPALTSRVARGAFHALKSADIAIGPSTDGGYYLIGMKHARTEMFKGIQWSTNTVLKETITRATEMGLKIEILDILDDIDTPEDLERMGLL